MQINYSEKPFTGYRIVLTKGKSTTVYPQSGAYYKSFADAVGVLEACLLRNPSKFSFTSFRIRYEESGAERPIPESDKES